MMIQKIKCFTKKKILKGTIHDESQLTKKQISYL